MLFVHEVHSVRGDAEEAFEALYRDGWLPALAGTDARLLYYLDHVHGTGASYRVVTITAVRDASAWAMLTRRLDDGDLRSWQRDLDATRHDVRSKILVPLPWSPLQDVEFD